MGLFDKINSDGTGSTGTFIQSVVTFAKLDLNGIFKMAIPAMVQFFNYAVAFFKDVFGNSNCNDQDRVLVERFDEQIPGMSILLSDLGYWDSSIGDHLRENPDNIYSYIEQMGRPKGAEPCNSLIYPARLLFTILFGVPIINSDFLDALDTSADAYIGAAGVWAVNVPRNAIDRAVMLKKKYFPISTYNRVQWDLNKFQEYPLVAPVPDPAQPGKFYTGDFLGVKIVDGWVIGDPIPDVEDYIRYFDPVTGTWKRATGTDVINIGDLPTIPDTVAPGAGSSPLDRLTNFLKNADPLMLGAIALAIGYVAYEVEEND